MRKGDIMNDIKKERLMVSITSLAGILCVFQNYIGGWEMWVPPIIIVGIVGLWWMHLAQLINPVARANMYFFFSALLLFYHGIHDTSHFDVSIATLLFMATFTLIDRMVFINLILGEYIIIMIIQLVLVYMNEDTELDASTLMKLIFHIGTVLCFYIFSRMTIRSRVYEHEKTEKWNDVVKKSEHDIEDFLSNISHEFRTPVNVINGMVAILKKDVDREELNSISEACSRLGYQIEDIQDYTEISRGDIILEEENYMCTSLINDVVTYYNSIDKKNLELVVDVDPTTPTLLNGDIKKIHKLFRHLLNNAVKFTRRGGVYIKVFPIVRDYGVNLVIEVTDTGKGMSRADIEKVSKGLYQADKKRNRSTGGIGLGIPIVYGFVHKMGGFVRITSREGRGTTVRLTVPQKVVDSTPCLSIRDEAKEGIIFYIKPEKYKVPEIRDYYRQMAVNLATGIEAKLFSASDARELKRLSETMKLTCIFAGEEEYEEDAAVLDDMAKSGVVVAVSANTGFTTHSKSGVLVMPKPLQGFSIARILNGDTGTFEETPEEAVRFDGLKALVVDDEPMNLVVATSLFKDYGIICDTAESGKEAIEKYDAGNYEVVFMDHMMPEMDGVEAMKRIRQVADAKFKHPVIIALTANVLSGAKEMFIKEGFDGFIAKPIDIGEFERLMKRVLPEDFVKYEGRDE